MTGRISGKLPLYWRPGMTPEYWDAVRRERQLRQQETAARTRRTRAQRLRQSKERTSRAQWQELVAAHNHRCLCCGRREGDMIPLADGTPNPRHWVVLVRDHIIAVCKGGDDSLANSQPLCTDCNTAKARRSTDYRAPRMTREDPH